MKTVIIFIIVVFFIFFICRQVYKFGKLASKGAGGIPSRTGSVSELQNKINSLMDDIRLEELKLETEIESNNTKLSEMRRELDDLIALKNKYKK